MSGDVASPNAAHRAMVEESDLVHDLLGGTRAMRAAGLRWLPREPRESAEAYRLRLNRSVLFNGLGRALETLVGKPMARPVTVAGVPDRRIAACLDDVDLAGLDLSGFAADVLRAALADGVTHVLVDYPTPPAAGPSAARVAAPAARPYLVHVPAAALIGWRLAPGDGGPNRLDRLRIRETVVEADGPWGERAVEQIRVLSPGRFALYRRKPGLTTGAPWVEVANGASSYPGLPLFTLYAQRTGFLTGRPALMDLAWLNLAHWQSASDQRQIFHMLCGTMALNGLDNVRCYRAAVSDRAGETLTYDLPDYRQANNFGGLELVPPALSDNADLVKAGREAAPTITIDSFAVKVDLIKLDVEGMELRALEGGRHTIARDKPIIFLEFIKSDQDAIAAFLGQQGYHGYAIEKDLVAVPPERNITITGLKKVF